MFQLSKILTISLTYFFVVNYADASYRGAYFKVGGSKCVSSLKAMRNIEKAKKSKVNLMLLKEELKDKKASVKKLKSEVHSQQPPKEELEKEIIELEEEISQIKVKMKDEANQYLLGKETMVLQNLELENVFEVIAITTTNETGKVLTVSERAELLSKAFPEFTEEQIQNVMHAHLLPGGAGELTFKQRRERLKLLTTDPGAMSILDARIILEMGFAGEVFGDSSVKSFSDFLEQHPVYALAIEKDQIMKKALEKAFEDKGLIDDYTPLLFSLQDKAKAIWDNDTHKTARLISLAFPTREKLEQGFDKPVYLGAIELVEKLRALGLSDFKIKTMSERGLFSYQKVDPLELNAILNGERVQEAFQLAPIIGKDLFTALKNYPANKKFENDIKELMNDLSSEDQQELIKILKFAGAHYSKAPGNKIAKSFLAALEEVTSVDAFFRLEILKFLAREKIVTRMHKSYVKIFLSSTEKLDNSSSYFQFMQKLQESASKIKTKKRINIILLAHEYVLRSKTKNIPLLHANFAKLVKSNTKNLNYSTYNSFEELENIVTKGLGPLIAKPVEEASSEGPIDTLLGPFYRDFQSRYGRDFEHFIKEIKSNYPGPYRLEIQKIVSYAQKHYGLGQASTPLESLKVSIGHNSEVDKSIRDNFLKNLNTHKLSDKTKAICEDCIDRETIRLQGFLPDEQLELLSESFRKTQVVTITRIINQIEELISRKSQGLKDLPDMSDFFKSLFLKDGFKNMSLFSFYEIISELDSLTYANKKLLSPEIWDMKKVLTNFLRYNAGQAKPPQIYTDEIYKQAIDFLLEDPKLVKGMPFSDYMDIFIPVKEVDVPDIKKTPTIDTSEKNSLSVDQIISKASHAQQHSEIDQEAIDFLVNSWGTKYVVSPDKIKKRMVKKNFDLYLLDNMNRIVAAQKNDNIKEALDDFSARGGGGGRKLWINPKSGSKYLFELKGHSKKHSRAFYCHLPDGRYVLLSLYEEIKARGRLFQGSAIRKVSKDCDQLRRTVSAKMK